MASYIPNTAEPYPGDDTPDLASILKEVKQGCPTQESSLVHARELQDWYDGDSEKYIAFKPAEDALSWLTRPKRVSFITRQAVNKLCSHLYKPGPRHRRITSDAALDAWYNNVAQDIQLNGLMQQADRLATLHGLCAIGIYPTGNPGRPINYHLFPRQDFVYWASPDDPRVATAVCTITRVDHDTIRYRLWTRSHYYTFFKGKTWGYTPGGWNVARFDPGSSGPHPYGVLPFAFVTHELPTTELETRGLGHLLAKINRALNIDKSNLALWVHHYARPLGFVSGVGPEWRPKFIDGGFVTLPAKPDSTESAPTVPEAKYLESSIDIAALREYIRGEANEALKELDIPITIEAASDGGGGGGARMASGVAIAASDADLITYAKGRQPLYELHETRLVSLVCRIAASVGAAAGIAADLLGAVAADPSLRIAWPEPSIDLPGPDRDNADTFELVNDLTDPIELLMRRQGLSEPEAIEQYRAIQRRKQIAAALQADPMAELELETPADGQVDDDESKDRPDGQGENAEAALTPDMGIGENGPSPETAPASDAQPNVSVTVAVDPQFPIPAAPLILPATPGYGSWGTES
jgi:hypothetical protein